MPKKNTKKKLPALQKFALTSLALLILMVGGTYLYVSELDNRNVSNFLEWFVLNKSIPDKPVKDMITYTLPSGWTEETEAENGTVILRSADYKAPTTLNDTDGSGVVVSLDVSPKYRFESIKSQRRDWNNNSLASSMMVSDISIDGLSGLKYEFSHDSTYTLEYFLVKDNYTTKIFVENYNRTAIDERYLEDINSIIDSIQFK